MNFKHGGGQKIFPRSTREFIPTSHFQNDGATSTSAEPVSNSMLLKGVEGKEEEKGQRRMFT